MSERVAIGIGGGTGAGKTTLARRLADTLATEVTIVCLDAFYRDRSHLPMERRRIVNFDHPDAVEWPLVRDRLLALLGGESVGVPQWDYAAHARAEEGATLTPGRVIVVEGLYALYPAFLVRRYATGVYLEAPADVRVLRCVKRDLDGRGRPLADFLEHYPRTIKPMHEQFVAPTRSRADVVLDGESLDEAVSVLRERLAQAVPDVVRGTNAR